MTKLNDSKEENKVKLIISGSTHIHSRPELLKAIAKHKLKDRIKEIVVGQEPGMSQCGRIWSIENDIPVKRFVRFRGIGNNRRTNHIKKLQMLQYADALLFITDGIVSLADQILELAKDMKLKVFVYTIGGGEGGG